MDSTGGAVIQDNNGSHPITAPVVLNADTTLNVANAADSVTMSGAISGAGAFTKAGNGSALISGAMTNAGRLPIPVPAPSHFLELLHSPR